MAVRTQITSMGSKQFKDLLLRIGISFYYSITARNVEEYVEVTETHVRKNNQSIYFIRAIGGRFPGFEKKKDYILATIVVDRTRGKVTQVLHPEMSDILERHFGNDHHSYQHRAKWLFDDLNSLYQVTIRYRHKKKEAK